MAQLSRDQELVEQLRWQHDRYSEDWWNTHKDDMWLDEDGSLHDDPYHYWNEQYDEQGGLLRLNLGGLKLVQLPPELWQFTSLQELDLYQNQLSGLPAELGQLANLRTLDLYQNQLSSLPAELGQLANLQALNLMGNQLSSLPSELGQLANLRGLMLTDNPGLQMPPPEVVRQGTRAIQAYLRALSQIVNRGIKRDDFL